MNESRKSPRRKSEPKITLTVIGSPDPHALLMLIKDQIKAKLERGELSLEDLGREEPSAGKPGSGDGSS